MVEWIDSVERMKLKMGNVINKIVFDRPSTQDTNVRYTNARFGQERDNNSLSEDRKP